LKESTGIASVVQARMGSQRLPGKVLMSIGELSILERIVSSLNSVVDPSSIIIATTNLSEDDPIEEFAINKKINIFRGDSHNVYSRFRNIAISNNQIRAIARFTADNPFLDLNYIETTMSLAQKMIAAETKFLITSRNTNIPIGLGVEIFSSELLRKNSLQLSEYDREHVTSWMYQNADIELVQVGLGEGKALGQPSLTVDNVLDYERATDFAGWLKDRQVTIELVRQWRFQYY